MNGACMPIQNMAKEKKRCSPRLSAQKESTNANLSKNETSDKKNLPSTPRAAAGIASATSKPSKVQPNKRKAIDVSPHQSRNEPSTSRSFNNAPRRATNKPTQQEVIKMTLDVMKATTNIRTIATEKAKFWKKTENPSKTLVDLMIEKIYSQRRKVKQGWSELGLDQLVFIKKRAEVKKKSDHRKEDAMEIIDVDEYIATKKSAVHQRKDDHMEISDDETLAEYVEKSTKEQSKSRSEAEVTGALPQTNPAAEIMSTDHSYSTNSTDIPPTRQTDEINTIDVFGDHQRKVNAKPTNQSENASKKGRDEVIETGKADGRTWQKASDFQREIFKFTYDEFVAHTNIVALQRKWVEKNHPGKDFLEDDEIDGLKFYYGIRVNLKLWRRSILKNLKYKTCVCQPN